MAEEFIRKDIFDARMDRMEALLEKTLIELKADNEKLRSELKTEILEVKGDINVINTRINGIDTRISDLQTVVYWGFAIIGFFIAFVSLAPSVGDFLKNFRRPSVSISDVERIVNAAINKALERG